MSPKEVFIMSRKRRSFTDEYKAEVVNLITEQGRPVGQVCQELGRKRLFCGVIAFGSSVR